MITVQCECGEKFHADEQYRGRKIKCRNCQRILTIQGKKFVILEDTNKSKSITATTTLPVIHTETISKKSASIYILAISAIFAITVIGFIVYLLASIQHAEVNKKLTAIPPSSGYNRVTPEAINLPKNLEPVDIHPIQQREKNKHDIPIPFAKHSPASDELTEPKNPQSLPLGSAPFGQGIHEGNSTVTIDNGTETDALVRVFRISKKKEFIRNFFIPYGKRFTAENLPNGNYKIRVAFGRDWNPKTRRFNFRKSFSESQFFDITETQWKETTEDGYIMHTHASEMSITLHKVPNGNFKTYPINEDEFWQ